jgi:hypothetical protein
MLRRLIQRYLPKHREIRDHRHLRWMGKLLHDPYLFHLNRRSVAGAVAIGLFMAFVPVPFQMVLAALASILLRVNVPIAVVMVWVTNPLTMAPIYFFAYKVGTWILGTPVHKSLADLTYLAWLGGELKAGWRPFLLGCLVCGTVSGLLGLGLVRLFWRMHILRRWRARGKCG